METLWENGQYGTSRNYQRALNSFSTFLDGNDIPFSSLDSALACRYEAWLWQQKGSEKQQFVLYADSACRL